MPSLTAVTTSCSTNKKAKETPSGQETPPAAAQTRRQGERERSATTRLLAAESQLQPAAAARTRRQTICPLLRGSALEAQVTSGVCDPNTALRNKVLRTRKVETPPTKPTKTRKTIYLPDSDYEPAEVEVLEDGTIVEETRDIPPLGTMRPSDNSEEEYWKKVLLSPTGDETPLAGYSPIRDTTAVDEEDGHGSDEPRPSRSRASSSASSEFTVYSTSEDEGYAPTEGAPASAAPEPEPVLELVHIPEDDYEVENSEDDDYGAADLGINSEQYARQEATKASERKRVLMKKWPRAKSKLDMKTFKIRFFPGIVMLDEFYEYIQSSSDPDSEHVPVVSWLMDVRAGATGLLCSNGELVSPDDMLEFRRSPKHILWKMMVRRFGTDEFRGRKLTNIGLLCVNISPCS
ncbi:hypothetical protein B0T26DRAFT_680983 [Lasiosphaeria miniovina]|uniref:Uncharacterized protein n=1 Tax=Lasiosphaeria miniovina TaxID=1954250 RepID=A0AA39ZTI8_9PEZI|nr:uncharacterized protein B0T26DRAFT_680983 [Lasiosphaeria miniovina]KAK0703283.1 hypothetical protein B0T26DRAFT_680983 [Lasiosphaeria miniovina]